MENDSKNIILLGTDKPQETMNKFLTDPRITPELKMLCFRLSSNPYLVHLIENTPISAIFEICEEYKKNPNLYDDIFSGNVKLLFNGLDGNSSPIFNPKKLNKNSNLKMYFGSNTLIGEIVEKFMICDLTSNRIKRITVKLKDGKIYTAGFNSKNKLVSLIVDFIGTKHEKDIIPSFLHITRSKRIDIVRF